MCCCSEIFYNPHTNHFICSCFLRGKAISIDSLLPCFAGPETIGTVNGLRTVTVIKLEMVVVVDLETNEIIGMGILGSPTVRIAKEILKNIEVVLEMTTEAAVVDQQGDHIAVEVVLMQQIAVVQPTKHALQL